MFEFKNAAVPSAGVIEKVVEPFNMVVVTFPEPRRLNIEPEKPLMVVVEPPEAEDKIYVKNGDVEATWR